MFCNVICRLLSLQELLENVDSIVHPGIITQPLPQKLLPIVYHILHPWQAFKVEQLPKKKARAAKLEPGAGPSASTRAQLEHHPPAVKPSAHPNMDGAAKEQTAERAGTGTASGQGTAPDGTAVPKRTEKEAKAESADGGALEVNGHDKGGKKGGAKKEKKKAAGPAPTPSGEIHCHYCGTRESTYWRRGPDGPKTLCNSCGLNWFRQRPMQREQVEKNNLMAKAVAAARLKRPANSLKEGPEKRKREEKKDGEKLREQLHGKKGVEALAAEMAGKTKGQLQALKKRRKIEEGGSSAEKGAIPRGLKGLKRAEKASIGRKLGDAAVKKAALIKRTQSQLSLMGLLESAPPQVPEAVPEVVALKPKGLVKGARFAPLKQAQTRLGAQKLLAVLNVIKQKKGFGRVTSTASLESVPSEQTEAFTEGLRKDEQTQGGEAPLSQEWGLDAKDAGLEGVPTPRKTGARSQRRPNTALLQGASFLPWKSRPRGWESSSLTFAAAESRLLKSQAANPGAAAGRPPVHKRAEFRPSGGAPTQQEQLEKPAAGAGGLGGAGGAPAVQQRGRMREGLAQGGRPGSPASGLSYEGSDADGFAGYDVLRKLLQEVDVTVTSPTSKGRPPLNRAGKMASGAPFSKKQETLERPPGGQARPGLKSYESFEDLVMGTAGGMKRYESFEDLALRAGPAFSRIESFEELALKAGPGIRRFESFEDLAMRSEPVFEVPTLKPPPAADVAVVKGEGGSDGDQGSEGSREGAGRKSGREKKQKTWDWAVVDGPKRKRKEKGLGKEGDQGKLADERPGLATGVFAEAHGQTSEGGGQSGSRQGQRLDENGQLPLVGGQSLAAQGPGAVGQSAGYTERPDRQPFPATGQSGAIEGRPQPPAGQSISPPGRSVTAVIRPSIVPGEAQPTNGQSLSPFVGSKGQQIPESFVGSLGLQTQGPGLGARGLSARALHLLVDCAVDTEPPAEVNMLMQDLETLAIGNPAMFETRSTLQGNGVLDGATGSGLQATNGATFALSNGQTFKQQALQPHAIRPLVTVASSGREESLVGGSVGPVGSEGLAAGELLLVGLLCSMLGLTPAYLSSLQVRRC
jgi:hypothetical protein